MSLVAVHYIAGLGALDRIRDNANSVSQILVRPIMVLLARVAALVTGDGCAAHVAGHQWLADGVPEYAAGSGDQSVAKPGQPGRVPSVHTAQSRTNSSFSRARRRSSWPSTSITLPTLFAIKTSGRPSMSLPHFVR